MKKNILFIIYTHSLGGGAEKILTNIVNGLNPEKYDIDILEYAYYGVKEEKINKNINRCKPIVSMTEDGKIKRLWKNIQVFSYAGFLRRRGKKYDLEISFNYMIPTFLLSRDVPTVSWIHGDIYDLKEKHYYRALQRHSLKAVNRIVAISQNTKESVLEVFPEMKEKLRVIYNGFDVESIDRDSRKECAVRLKQPAIVYVGRLEDGKNPLILLDVLKRLKERNQEVCLYYIGQGEKQGEIELKAKEYGLENQVELAGFQINPYPIMRQSRAICMMSNSEGFPTVFAEGMALGVPFISTPVGGVEELADGGLCGQVVQTVEECADAIEKVVLDEDEHVKMSASCLEHIKKFSLKAQTEKIEALIDEVIEGNES